MDNDKFFSILGVLAFLAFLSFLGFAIFLMTQKTSGLVTTADIEKAREIVRSVEHA